LAHCARRPVRAGRGPTEGSQAAGASIPSPTPPPAPPSPPCCLQFSALKPFVIISLSYLLFTTTDGAIRMIVLLHAYNSGFSAWQVAIMFTLYELAGGWEFAGRSHLAAMPGRCLVTAACTFKPGPKTAWSCQHACPWPPRPSQVFSLISWRV
jgi:hypothetical protein